MAPTDRQARSRAPGAAERSRPGRPGDAPDTARRSCAACSQRAHQGIARVPRRRLRCPIGRLGALTVRISHFSSSGLGPARHLPWHPRRCRAAGHDPPSAPAAAALLPRAQAASRCIKARESPPPDTATAPGHGMRRHRRRKGRLQLICGRRLCAARPRREGRESGASGNLLLDRAKRGAAFLGFRPIASSDWPSFIILSGPRIDLGYFLICSAKARAASG